MSKKVCVNIKSVQTADGESDTTELFTYAEFTKLKKGTYRISYHEDETTGFKGSRVTLDFSDDSVTMTRSGAASSNLIIEKDKRHFCHYGTPYGELMVGISTDEIRNEVNDHGGDLYLKYTIDINTGFMSDNEMSINIKEITPEEGTSKND